MSDTPSSWRGILDKGEDILWQGRPNGALVWELKHLPTIAFGMLFAGFALFWMIMASSAGGGFWMFGLIHFSVGLGVAFGPPFWSAYKRRNSWYTLTNRRAIIATDLLGRGRSLKSYPIDPDTPITYVQGPQFDSVYFATETRRTGRSGRRRNRDVGFDRITDGTEITTLIRQVQRGET